MDKEDMVKVFISDLIKQDFIEAGEKVSMIVKDALYESIENGDITQEQSDEFLEIMEQEFALPIEI